MITAEQIQAIATIPMPHTASAEAPILSVVMDKYSINSPLRMAHFMAQIMHESEQMQLREEMASGEEYEGRADLGNTQPGDGPLYKGRGFIQLTGRSNYSLYGLALGVDLLCNPELVATDYAADVSGLFWANHSLNALADEDNVNAITRMINGGYNGLQDRVMFLQRAKAAFGI